MPLLPGADAHRRRGGALVALAFGVSRLFLLFFHEHTATDLKIYRGWIQQASSGLVPFRDFPIEYPPFAWWVMQLPGTIEQASYHFRFRLLMGAADAVSFALLWWIAARRRPDAAGVVTATYVMTTIVLEFVLYDRLDILMLAFVLAALAAWLQSSGSRHAGRWKSVAYGCVGLGASYKLLPIVILPLFMIADWRQQRRIAPVAWRTAACLAIVSLPFAVSYPAAGPATFGFLGYHTSRGVEIGSIWATLMWLTSWSDPSIAVTAGFGSWELSGRFGVALARIASIAAIAFLLMIGLWAMRMRPRCPSDRVGYLLALLALGSLPAVLDVFSVQYLLWALPVLMLAAVEVTGRTRPLMAIAAACVAIAALTTVFYPFGMRFVVPLNDGVMLLLAVRNLLYVSVCGWLVWAVMRDREGPDIAGQTLPAASISAAAATTSST